MERAKKIYNRWQREERMTAKGRANVAVATMFARCWLQIRAAMPAGCEEYIGGAYLRMTGEADVSEADFASRFIAVLTKYRRDMQYAERKACDYAIGEPRDNDNDDRYAMD